MDLSKFKGKTLDDATLSELAAAITAHVEPIEARATAAEAKERKATKESIDGRKAKDARIERLSELLGVEPDADLDKIDVKGMADASKQFEAQLKRVTRERDEAVAKATDVEGKWRTASLDRAVAEAIAKQPFADPEVASVLVRARIKREGEEDLFTGPDGKLVSIDDGVAWLAKSKPALMRPAGEGPPGSGYRGAAGGPAQTANPWDKRTFNITQQIELKSKDPALAARMQQAAQQSAPATS